MSLFLARLGSSHRRPDPSPALQSSSCSPGPVSTTISHCLPLSQPFLGIHSTPILARRDVPPHSDSKRSAYLRTSQSLSFPPAPPAPKGSMPTPSFEPCPNAQSFFGCSVLSAAHSRALPGPLPSSLQQKTPRMHGHIRSNPLHPAVCAAD